MFTLKQKRFIVSISLGMLAFLIFAVVGCGSKDDSVLSFAMSDDGEAPKAPEVTAAIPEYLYNQENDVNEGTRHFAVLLQWKPVTQNLKGNAKSNIIGYRVYRNTKDKAIGSNDYGDEIFEDYDFDALTENGVYTYYISAVDAMKRESYSQAIKVSLKSEGETPTKPRNFYVLPAENKVAVLSWEAPENADICAAANDPICKYKVSRRESGEGKFTTIALVPSDLLTFYDDSIVEGKSYAYRIYAVTTSGYVSPSSEERTVSFTFTSTDYLSPATAPETISVQPDNTSGIANAKKITWSIPKWIDNGTNGKLTAAGIAAYRIYRAQSTGLLNDTSEIAGLTYSLVRIVPNQYYFIDTTIDTVNAGIVYYYRLSAITTQGLEGDLSAPAYYYNNSSTATATPLKFSCMADETGALTFYFSFRYEDKDDKKTYYLYRSLNKRYFEKFATIQPSKLTLDASTGEIFAHFTLEEKIQANEIWYFKLAAHNTANTFHSNLSYYVKAEKFSILKDNKYVLQAENMVSSIKVRDVHYAWYSNFLYPGSETGKDSLWDYDVKKGVHYNVSTKSFSIQGKAYQGLYFDPMGSQHPPTAPKPNDCFTGFSEEVSYSTADYAFVDLITNETRTIGGWVYLEDTARPIITANSKTYSSDTYKYNYITCYNDDGFSFWQDINYDGVSLSEIFYRETQLPLLKHGMEGKEVRLMRDVDPWTHMTPLSFANVFLALNDQATTPEAIFDFWPTVITDPTGAKAWNKSDFDWNGGNGVNGGCAYYLGADSGTAIMARDYFADGHGDFSNFRINWRENYFGPLYSNSWPGYAGNWPVDAYSWKFVYPDDRPQRKDNCLSYDIYGNGIDYQDASYIWQLDRTVYDIYQDQFRFSWNPPESGRYNIDMYFYETPGSGTYLVILRHRGNIIGSPSIINLSRNASVESTPTGSIKVVGAFNDPYASTDSPYDPADARDGHWEAYLESNFPIDFYFSPIAGQTDVYHDGNYQFSDGSAYDLILERIEFTKLDSN
ncbi:MAG: hypothetical protein PHQ23_06945 [Candidatus Wallbacteria bacterium]|nr:hypothetical protein [Candidatus Wallbacteria bacterium]